MSDTDLEDRLWNSDHPYHCQSGCYYAGPNGHRRPDGTYDGAVHHVGYASWKDFKEGTRIQYAEDQRVTANVTAKDTEGGSMYYADLDLDLLVRWDWIVLSVDAHRLQLYFLAQRKAYPTSVYVTVTRDDEKEIRAWLFIRWCHMLRLWSPISGWPLEPLDDKDKSVPNSCHRPRHVLHDALEHVSCKTAEMAKREKEPRR